MLKVVRRDGQICQECNRNVPDTEIEFDHIVPASKGGPVSVDNLRVLCKKCNRKKGNSLEKILESRRT
jgi:5-methylcytosine-specific restriction endonuclease McrA